MSTRCGTPWLKQQEDVLSLKTEDCCFSEFLLGPRKRKDFYKLACVNMADLLKYTCFKKMPQLSLEQSNEGTFDMTQS